METEGSNKQKKKNDSELVMRTVELPESLVGEVEQLMKEKYERRPVKVSLGIFIGDLIQEGLAKVKARDEYSPILEDYSVDHDCVYIKDNQKDIVAELRFKDEIDLYCNVDGAKNCVHVGFAWSIPSVQKLIYMKKINIKK